MFSFYQNKIKHSTCFVIICEAKKCSHLKNRILHSMMFIARKRRRKLKKKLKNVLHWSITTLAWSSVQKISSASAICDRKDFINCDDVFEKEKKFLSVLKEFLGRHRHRGGDASSSLADLMAAHDSDKSVITISQKGNILLSLFEKSLHLQLGLSCISGNCACRTMCLWRDGSRERSDFLKDLTL